MPSSSPSSRQTLELVVARRGREDVGAGALGQLDRRDPDAAGAGVDQRGLAGGQTTEFEEAVVRGAERHRHTGRLLGREAVGNHPGESLGHHAELGVRTV